MPTESTIQVRTGVSDGVGRIELVQPERMNALTRQLEQELIRSLDELDADPDVRAIIISGRGDNFCSGADIGELLASRDDIAAYMREAFEFFTRVESCGTPTIAQVDGYCLGGGLELALACDLIVAGDRARFGLPETAFGLVPGFALQRLSPLIGSSAAAQMLLSSRFVDAEHACRLGLVLSVHAGGELAAAAQRTAGHLVGLDERAVRVARDTLREYRNHAGSLDNSVWANVALFHGSSTQTSLQSFVDKAARPKKQNGETNEHD